VGFPIRTSPDHRSVVTSPRLIADSYVLHRLLVPRHSPCALEDLGNTKKYHKDTKNCLQDARVHYAVLKKQPHTTTTHQPADHDREDQPHTPTPTTRGQGCVQPQNPIACLHLKPTSQTIRSIPHRGVLRPSYDQRAKRPSVDVPPMSNHPHHERAGKRPPILVMLLRKEVIQPHLPVRLPCYDLVPITDPTFDGSPHKGWATGFGCYRLS
jgi:hypothetical protein